MSISAKPKPATATKKIVASKLQVERLQSRAVTDSAYVRELSERMASGDNLPPITVVSDGSTKWLADGIHRLDAAIAAGRSISFETIPGDRKKAIEIACGSNQSHGLRRTNADKRHAVTTAIRELGKRSDRAIAEICGVGNKFVGDVRRQVCSEHTSHRTAQVATAVTPEAQTGGKTATSGQNQVCSEHTSKSNSDGNPPTSRVGKDGKSYPAAPKNPAAAKRPAKNGKPRSSMSKLSELVRKKTTEIQKLLDGEGVPHEQSEHALESMYELASLLERSAK